MPANNNSSSASYKIWLKRLILLPLLLFILLTVLVFITSYWLVYTEAGLNKVAHYATSFEPRLSLTTATGNLFGDSHFALISWQQEGVKVTLTDTNIQLTPLCLISLNICAKDITTNNIGIELSADENSTDDQPVALPTVSLPFDIAVSKININRLIISSNTTGSSTEVASILFSAENIRAKKFLWHQSKLSFSPLIATLWGETLRLKGSINLSKDYAIKVTANHKPQQLPDFSANIAKKNSTTVKTIDEVTAKLSGSLRQLRAQFSTQGLIEISGNGEIQPLIANVPFSANIGIEAPLTVIANDENIAIKQAVLKLQGDLNQLTLSLNSQSTLPFAIGSSSLQLAASTDYQSLAIRQAEITSDNGQVVASGQLYFDSHSDSELSVTASNVNPALINPQYQGKLNIKAALQIKSLLTAPALTVTLNELNGDFMDTALNSSGTITLTPNQQLQFKHWGLMNDGNRFTINGDFPNGTAQWSANIAHIEHFMPDISGRLSASGSLLGTLEKPSLNASLKAEDIRYQNLHAKTISSSVSLRKLAWEKSKIELKISGAKLTGQEETLDFQLSVDATQRRQSAVTNHYSPWTLSQHLDVNYILNLQQADLWNSTLQCALHVNLETLAVDNPCKKLRLAVNEKLVSSPVSATTIATADLNTTQREAVWSNWSNKKPLSANWQPGEPLHIDSFCLRNNASAVCLQKPIQWQPSAAHATTNPAPTAIHLAGTRLPFSWLMRFTPSAYQLQGEWGFNAVLAENSITVSDKNQRNWQAIADVKAKNLLISIDLDETSKLKIPVEDFNSALTIDKQGVRSELSLTSKYLGNINGNIDYQQQIWNGKIILKNFTLQPLQSLFPNVNQLTGEVSSNLNLMLADNNVVIDGQLALSDFYLRSRDLPIDISNGNSTFNFNKQQVLFNGQAAIGEGHANFNGKGEWTNTDWLANVDVSTTAIRIEPLPRSYLNVVSDIQITAAPGQIDIGGKLNIPKARIEISKLPKNAVTVSDDTIIDDQTLDSGGMAVSANVETTLGDDVKFTGFGLTTNLSGDLIIKQKPGQLITGNGIVNLRDGRYRAYGQDLLIEEGRMIFTGPLSNPELLVTAIRNHTENNVRVGVLATGSAKEPIVTLFSSPAMSEQHILYYLLTGKGPSNTNTDESRLAQQTAIALGLAQSNKRAGDIANALGIEDFQMTTDMGRNGEEAQFSGYISPDLYLTYGVSLFDQLSSITARYKIKPDISVEIYNSTSSAIDVFWSIVNE